MVPPLSELDRPHGSGPLDAILRVLPDGLCLTDGCGRITNVNERLCEMTGFSGTELIGATLPYPFWPEDADERAAVEAGFRSALDGARTEAEYVFARRDGQRFHVAVTTAAIDEDRPCSGIVCLVREVTSEVRRRERLAEAHRVARLVSLEFNALTGSVELSRDLQEVAGLRLPDELPLGRLLDVVGPSDRAAVEATVERILAGALDGDVLELSLPIGGLEWVELRMVGVPDPCGRVHRIRATVQDVSSRKLAEIALEQSEDRLLQAQRVAGIGSFEADYASGEVSWSSALYELFGIAQTESVSRLDAARERLPLDGAEELRELASDSLADGRPRCTVRSFVRDGEQRHAEIRLEPVDRERAPKLLRGTIQDITERERAAREIRMQAHLLDSVHVAVTAFDLDGLVTHWNRAAEHLTGFTPAEAIGRHVLDVSVAPSSADHARQILADVQACGEWEGQFELARRDGSTFPAFVRDAIYHDLDGQPQGIVAVAVDITERVAAERQLRRAHDHQRAITDSIGQGLCAVDEGGRLLYMNRAAEDLLGWTQDELVGKVMHDVTHFRRPDGSPLTRDDCALRSARASGEVVRIDDEMFIRKDGSDLPVEITTAPFETEAGARGSVVVFNDITERLARENALRERMEVMSWVGRVYDALAEDRFVLYAQPIVDVRTGETVQHELLLRMLDEDGGIVAPGEFLPAAEEHGVITDIDRWVMREAVRIAAAGHAVELNLSAHSVADPMLFEELSRHVQRTGADPSLIVIELTETALLRDEAAALAFIERGRLLGCKFALDDFGTGYGGFSYLKRLPFDSLKIDREFVRDLVDNAASRQVVEACVGLARGFGQVTVAEGVEDEATLEVLREMGVDSAQGYLLARPAPVEEVLGR